MTLEQKKEKINALIDDLNTVQEKSNKLLEEFSISLCKILEEFRDKYGYMLETEDAFYDLKDCLYFNDDIKEGVFEDILSQINKED